MMGVLYVILRKRHTNQIIVLSAQENAQIIKIIKTFYLLALATLTRNPRKNISKHGSVGVPLRR